MKKRVLFIIILFMIIIQNISVLAVEYPLNSLIPKNTVATVHTSLFDYNDFSYSSIMDEKGNGLIRFASIHNNKEVRVPVSIDVLLFDKDKKNIGFLTYCSEKDFDSEYASYLLQGNSYSSYSIKVSKKYLGEEWNPSDIEYIAVMDDNEFCYIGGYTNYIGKSIEEITDKEIEPSKKEEILGKIMDFMKTELFSKIMIGLGIFLGFILIGSIINSLYKKMYRGGTILAYIPVTDMYITMKVVYGKIIAIIYLVLFIVSVILYFLKIHLMAYVMVELWILSFILIFVKLFSRNYDLFYLDPAMNDSKHFNLDMESTNMNNNNSNSISTNISASTNTNTNTYNFNDMYVNSNLSNNISNSLDDDESNKLYDDDFSEVDDNDDIT